MKREYDALLINKAWDLVALPLGEKSIPSRWVFTVKPATRATMTVYKSRLVAKGFRHIFGLDYSDIFAPMVRLPGLRTYLAVAIDHHIEVHSMDVKNAFLNAALRHEI